ncbi:hypothetical protein NP493_571g02011 [Ridgeia piscesae]|uniref:Neurotransmitter-gated ion-channel transmembrane domain-containing protein n=1 Tax=Ridgeia piscesae TaxID=27915 RepID=A0AAD9NRD0_RIDPI|nr:hypothetical protein NP493_571g02011 [Ridgeia piscesae]
MDNRADTPLSYSVQTDDISESCRCHQKHYRSAIGPVSNVRQSSVATISEVDGYTTREVTLRWHWPEPIEMSKDIKLSEFVLSDVKNDNCSAIYSTGNYSCIYAKFLLNRQFHYYLVQTYVPTILIVILSWVSFWIDETAVPARITLGILTVLTMTSQSTIINQRLPRVSYIKAIDVWMSTCLMFVFGSLVEFSIVNVIAREAMLLEKTDDIRRYFPDNSEESEGPTVKSTLSSIHHHASFFIEQPLLDVNVPYPEHVETHKDLKKKRVTSVSCCTSYRAVMMDKVSRVLFPALFGVFNVIYWSCYLTSSDTQ